jgi:hypothetical protein
MRMMLVAVLGLGLVACAVPVEAHAAAGAPSWQDAVAELAGERTKAATCVRLLKRNAKDDQAMLDRGELSYGEAKGEMDAVIAGLITAVASHEEPASFSTLELRLNRGIELREAFCAEVRELLPPAEAGSKGVWDTLIGGMAGPGVELVKQLYEDYRDSGELTRRTIETQLEATRWPAFAAVSPES